MPLTRPLEILLFAEPQRFKITILESVLSGVEAIAMCPEGVEDPKG
jgi:hypothetical protein